MVYLVMLAAPPAPLQQVVQQLSNLSNGFFTLSAPGPLGPQLGVYLVATDYQTGPLRDWLHALGATQVVVIRAQNDWGTWGHPQLAEWLQGAAGVFSDSER